MTAKATAYQDATLIPSSAVMAPAAIGQNANTVVMASARYAAVNLTIFVAMANAVLFHGRNVVTAPAKIKFFNIFLSLSI